MGSSCGIREYQSMLYDALKEKALANFELLLNHWKLQYTRIGAQEYDIIATWRADKNFGGCRFNIEKGRGADFAGSYLTDENISKFGIGFTADDFVGISEQGQGKIGFDIVGLCQRLYHLNSYKDGTKYLDDDLRKISLTQHIIQPAYDAADRRREDLEKKKKKILKYATDLWESSKYHKFEGSIGEKYLNNRYIHQVKEQCIRFIPSLTHSPTKQQFPALIFKVQQTPTSPLTAIHRIYLTSEGKKANIDNPKMALASIQGSGIWFGIPGEVLFLTEGPENALTLRDFGAEFVVSSIYASNMPNIAIPKEVKKIIILSDEDNAGKSSYLKTIDKLKYSNLIIEPMSI